MQFVKGLGSTWLSHKRGPGKKVQVTAQSTGQVRTEKIYAKPPRSCSKVRRICIQCLTTVLDKADQDKVCLPCRTP
jgi:hypothetical protein